MRDRIRVDAARDQAERLHRRASQQLSQRSDSM